jgi:hypothetical protein
MIIPSKELLDFEKTYIAESRNTPDMNFKIMESMYYEARALKIFPLKDPLDGIEHKIRIAEVINSVPENSEKNRP